MELQSMTVTVQSGESIEANFSLATIQPKTVGAVLTLDRFMFTAMKTESAAALAINEQRFAGNVKNFVSTDAYVEVFLQNVGEFLKLMPGIEPIYSNMNVQGISVPRFAVFQWNTRPLPSMEWGWRPQIPA